MDRTILIRLQLLAALTVAWLLFTTAYPMNWWGTRVAETAHQQESSLGQPFPPKAS